MSFTPYVRRYDLGSKEQGPTPSWIEKVPAYKAVSELGGLNLDAPITVISGDNGAGKSTILEGIALSYGFNERGGPFALWRSSSYSNPLKYAMTLTLGDRAKDGYFLRAESHFNVATAFGADGIEGQDLHDLSHGESVFHVVQRSFDGSGLYLLDEPESGLSLVRQLALMAEISLAAEAGAQFIIVTHSPILLAIPGARLIEFTLDGNARMLNDVRDTLAFLSLKDFLEDPHSIAEFMVEHAANKYG